MAAGGPVLTGSGIHHFIIAQPVPISCGAFAMESSGNQVSRLRHRTVTTIHELAESSKWVKVL